MGVGGSPELQGAWKGNSPGRGIQILWTHVLISRVDAKEWIIGSFSV